MDSLKSDGKIPVERAWLKMVVILGNTISMQSKNKTSGSKSSSQKLFLEFEMILVTSSVDTDLKEHKLCQT